MFFGGFSKKSDKTSKEELVLLAFLRADFSAKPEDSV
jgi:hypothetical protein